MVGLIYGAMGSVGSRNLARSKARTSLTVGVLMIGVVLVADGLHARTDGLTSLGVLAGVIADRAARSPAG